ncbi:MAG: UDP-N-acetylmuramoyl-L-alanyl-D-glutamate--2,6-diaminopimelate ligase [Lachnospiraceae bacterium]|nr:UDP-N-acetylmuramoyl-L-alanyl-D-glutamate--2,6-diaminopimelate ligase [Lachnospiraceae bacterium]
MRIGDWLAGTDCVLLQGSLDTWVEEVVYDSRKACPASVFVCIKGSTKDSHSFIPEALAAGCKVLVVERNVSVPSDVTVLHTVNGRLALALLSAARFGHPAKRLVTIGITGTKGKTTTSYMLKKLLEAAGKKVGLIGTNGAVIGDERFPTANTTPESYVVQEYFARMADAGCDCVVMEVSSQALMLHRVGGIRFDYGLFTNLSPDHIGPKEHESFEEYLYYKSRLLTVCRTGVVNRLADHYDEIVKDADCQLHTYALLDDGMQAEADLMGSQICYASDHAFVGVEFLLHGKASERVRVGMPGRFNADNALAALAVCGLVLEDEGADEAVRGRVLSALETIRVDGRMEIAYVSKKCSVIVDYAHNAVSMESLLMTLRDYHPKRLVCVFGCGGNRARERRYSMGEIGGRLADLCILTADNPRFEKNEDIIKDIETGIAPTGGRYLVIPDRREAIFYALRHAEDKDMIAVIGKGHEDYQEIEGVRHHFLDREVVEEAAKEIRAWNR